MTKLYQVLAIIAVIGSLAGGIYLKGFYDGKSSERARIAEDTKKLNDKIAEQQGKLAELEAERLRQEQVLEYQVDQLRRLAHEDPNANRPALGVDSVLRLNAVR